MTGSELKLLREKAGLTQKELGQLIGKQPSTITKWETGDNQIPARLIEKIIFEINHFSPHSITLTASERPTIYSKARASRYEPTNHSARIRSLFGTITDHFQDGIYEMFEVDGSSMEPTLSSGDRLLCRRGTIDDIFDGRVYVLVTNRPDLRAAKETGVWVKRCQLRKGAGYINCRSDNANTTEPFPVFRLKASDILEVWNPVVRVTWNMADPNRNVLDKLSELESRNEMLEGPHPPSYPNKIK